MLKMVADGLSTDDISKILGIAFKTVACHRSRLLQKFDAPNAIVLAPGDTIEDHRTVRLLCYFCNKTVSTEVN